MRKLLNIASFCVLISVSGIASSHEAYISRLCGSLSDASSAPSCKSKCSNAGEEIYVSFHVNPEIHEVVETDWVNNKKVHTEKLGGCKVADLDNWRCLTDTGSRRHETIAKDGFIVTTVTSEQVRLIECHVRR